MAAKAQITPNFIEETFAELRKVTWPSRPETIRLTMVVIAISLLIGLYLGIIDILLAKLLAWLTTAR